MRRTWCLVFATLAILADAQPVTRRAANISALLAFPSFYHLRPVVIVGRIANDPNGEIRVSDGGISLLVVSKGSAPDGLHELRGEFWDLGRMQPDEARLVGYDLRASFKIDPAGAWPRPGEVTALVTTAVLPASVPLGGRAHRGNVGVDAHGASAFLTASRRRTSDPTYETTP